MIAFLEGRLLYKSPEYIIASVQGVGYQIAVPLSSFYELPELNESVHLHVHTHVRQDAIQLFGFLTSQEKEIFLLLLSVSGIGPKVALNILSGISPLELGQALIAEDSGRIQRIPGIGRKSAERIVLELKDKIKKLQSRILLTLTAAEEGREKVWEDALSVLLNLGYPRPTAEKALVQARKESGEETALEEILRKTLRSLSK